MLSVNPMRNSSVSNLKGIMVVPLYMNIGFSGNNRIFEFGWQFGLRKLQEPEKHVKWAFSVIKLDYEFYLHAAKQHLNYFLKIS